MQNPRDLLGLPADAPREAIVRAYHDLLLHRPQELDPRRCAEIERAYRSLTTLEECMREAMAFPVDTLRVLFRPPAMVLDTTAVPVAPQTLAAPELESLLGPWRRQLLREILVY